MCCCTLMVLAWLISASPAAFQPGQTMTGLRLDDSGRVRRARPVLQIGIAGN